MPMSACVSIDASSGQLMDIYERIKKLAEIDGYTIKELEKKNLDSLRTLYTNGKNSPRQLTELPK